MADKSIFELNLQTTFATNDRLVVGNYANSDAEAITGQTLVNLLATSLDGHGGIQSIVKTSSTGTDPVIDTYTITMADTTTTTFTVTNGLKGDQGLQTFIYFRWAHVQPSSWSDTTSQPDEWMGVYAGTATTPPTTVSAYTWVKVRGDTGETGAAASISSQSVTYMESTSGTVVPSGSWSENVPSVTPGNFLWTRTQLTFNDGSTVTSYSVSRYGIDGTGAVSSVNGQSPDVNGNVALTANNVPTSDNQSIQAHITAAETDIGDLQTDVGTLQSDMTTAQSDIADLDAALGNVKSDIGIVEDTNTATHTIAAGQYVIWKDALYKASTAIPLGTTLSASNLTAVSGGGLNDIFQNLSNSLLLSGDWRNAPVGLSAYNYEGADTTTYDLPSGYATVLVIKATSSNGGIAYATDWRNNAGKPTWVNNRHGDAWEGWLRIDSSSIFSVEYIDTLGLSANASQSFAVSKQRVGAVPVMAFMTLGSYGDWCNLNQSITYGSDTVSVTGFVKSWNSGSITVELKTTVLWRQIV